MGSLKGLQIRALYFISFFRAGQLPEAARDEHQDSDEDALFRQEMNSVKFEVILRKVVKS
jgi:hypothetical protein